MIESSFPKRKMGRECWKFLAFLICSLNFAATALLHGVRVRSERDHHGDGRGAGPQHHQHANFVWAAPQGTVEVILLGNTIPVATQLPPQHLWLAAGWAPQSWSQGQERGNTDWRERKQRGRCADSCFSKECSHVSWGNHLDLDQFCLEEKLSNLPTQMEWVETCYSCNGTSKLGSL